MLPLTIIYLFINILPMNTLPYFENSTIVEVPILSARLRTDRENNRVRTDGTPDTRIFVANIELAHNVPNTNTSTIRLQDWEMRTLRSLFNVSTNAMVIQLLNSVAFGQSSMSFTVYERIAGETYQKDENSEPFTISVTDTQPIGTHTFRAEQNSADADFIVLAPKAVTAVMEILSKMELASAIAENTAEKEAEARAAENRRLRKAKKDKQSASSQSTPNGQTEIPEEIIDESGNKEDEPIPVKATKATK